jgi:hypothetical protein
MPISDELLKWNDDNLRSAGDGEKTVVAVLTVVMWDDGTGGSGWMLPGDNKFSPAAMLGVLAATQLEYAERALRAGADVRPPGKSVGEAIASVLARIAHDFDGDGDPEPEPRPN